MLHVIEHDQRLPLAQEVINRLPWVTVLSRAARPVQIQACQHAGHKQVRVGDRREENGKRTVLKVILTGASHLQREPCFADTPSAKHGNQAHTILHQQVTYRRHLLLAPHKLAVEGPRQLDILLWCFACDRVRNAVTVSTWDLRAIRAAPACSTSAGISSSGTSRARAINSATCSDGFRVPASILRIVSKAHPTRTARPSCVIRRALRVCLTHLPNRLLLSGTVMACS